MRTKNRITITIDAELLEELKELTKGEPKPKVSTLVEKLIRQALKGYS